MDEKTYDRLAAQTFQRVEDAFDDVDATVADLAPGGDVMTITFGNGIRCVLNTQRVARQIWMAARATAYHFSYDEPSRRWLDDRGRGLELGQCLADIVREETGHEIRV